MDDILREITEATRCLEMERVPTLVTHALAQAAEPLRVLDALSAGMMAVGELFARGTYYLVDLVVAGEIMKEALAVLQPHMAVGSMGPKGTVVLGTVKGDVHDIGKNLVAHMLRGCGFQVLDLGVDVAPERFVGALRTSGAAAVGLSVLLTPMVRSVAETVSAIEEAGLRERVRIAIGGACTTPELGRRLGVDAVGRDPVEAVRIFESFLSS